MRKLSLQVGSRMQAEEHGFAMCKLIEWILIKFIVLYAVYEAMEQPREKDFCLSIRCLEQPP